MVRRATPEARLRRDDLDPSAGGLRCFTRPSGHQGAQPTFRRSDAFRAAFERVADTPLTMAATDHMPDPDKALALREPFIHGPSPMGDGPSPMVDGSRSRQQGAIGPSPMATANAIEVDFSQPGERVVEI